MASPDIDENNSPILEFKLEFDKEQDAYEPGTAVGGHIIVNLSRPVEISGIYLRFSGHLRVDIEKTKEESPNFENGHHQTLFEEGITVFGPDNSDELVTHPDGSNEHPFFYPLPTDLPSSFEGDHASVRYTCDVIMKGGEMEDKPYALTGLFTVYRKLDLNKEPRAIRRADQQEDIVQVPSCTGSGTVQVLFRLDSLGFVPLDDVAFYVQVKNGSSTTLKVLHVILKQIVTYDVSSLEGYSPSSGITTKQTTSVLNSVSKSKIKKKGHEEWMACPLIVPLVPPSRMDGCSCIDVKYVVEFQVEVKKGVSLTLSRDITIGTVSLTEDSLNDRTKSTTEDLEYMAELAKLRQSRRQTLMSQRGSLHFIMHPAYEIPKGAFISRAPESFKV